jgi:hypothetical protein
MKPGGPASRSVQTACYSTGPQGNVTQTSHKHVTKRTRAVSNATPTFDSGEAE